MFDKVIYKSAKQDEVFYHISRPKSDCESLHYKPRSSKFQSFNKFTELFELPDTDTVKDIATSLANQPNSFPFFNQSQTSNRNTRTKYVCKHYREKFILFSFHHFPLRKKNIFQKVEMHRVAHRD